MVSAALRLKWKLFQVCGSAWESRRVSVFVQLSGTRFEDPSERRGIHGCSEAEKINETTSPEADYYYIVFKAASQRKPVQIMQEIIYVTIDSGIRRRTLSMPSRSEVKLFVQVLVVDEILLWLWFVKLWCFVCEMALTIVYESDVLWDFAYSHHHCLSARVCVTLCINVCCQVTKMLTKFTDMESNIPSPTT